MDVKSSSLNVAHSRPHSYLKLVLKEHVAFSIDDSKQIAMKIFKQKRFKMASGHELKYPLLLLAPAALILFLSVVKLSQVR